MINEKFFVALFERSPLGIILCTVSGYIPVRANGSACRMLGFSEKELLETRMDLITHADDWALEVLLIEKLKMREVSSARMETRFIKSKGGILWVDANISLYQADDRTNDLIVFNFRDVIESKEGRLVIKPGGNINSRFNSFQDDSIMVDLKGNGFSSSQPLVFAPPKPVDELIGTLMKTERTLRQAQSIAKLGIWKMRIDTQLLEWSEETYRIFEVPIWQTMYYADFLQLVYPDDREFVDQAWQTALKNRSVYDVEHRILSAQGTKWVREQCEFEIDSRTGQSVLVFGIVKDITDQMLAKGQLEVKNQELQEIMDALDESSLVSIADTKGIILKVNRRFCEVAKYEAAELVGKSHNIINSGHHSKEFWKDFWHTIERGEVWRGEIKNRAKDGSEYWVNTTINPIRDEKGDIIHYLSIRQDITSRKRYEELLLESNLRLAQIEQFIDFTTDAIHVSDLDGQFVYINHVASQRLGIVREDCHKFNVSDIDVLFSKKCEWRKHVADLKEVGSISLEGMNLNQATGVIFPVEVTMRHIPIHERDYIIVVSRDISERKRNEMVLRESQARLAEAQRMAKLGYWECDLVTNKCWWSDEQYKINGIAKSEKGVSQDDFLNLLHPDDRQSFLETLGGVSPSSETSATYRIVRPDGEVRLILGYSNVIRNEGGKPVKLSGVNQDITDRIMTEKALRESEEMLRKAQAVAKIGSWKLDVKSGRIEWSDEAFHIFNAPKEKTITYRDFLSYVHPEDKELVDSSWSAALGGSPYDVVHRIIVNNEIKWVREQAELIFDDFKNLIYGFGTVQDITDHKILQDSNLIFNQSLLLTGLGSWRVSLKNNDLFLSDNVYNLHGLRKEGAHITFENYQDLIYPEDRERIQMIIARALLEKGSFETEYRVEKSPGAIHWLSINGKVLVNQEGDAIEMYGIVRDITVEKNSTAELIKARKEAEEASYIKDEFLSVMSHEIRTPLNSVIGLSNLILKRNPREDQLEVMKILKGSADNLLHLVNDILDFNKIRAGKLELEFIPFRLTIFLQHLHAAFKLSAHDKDIGFSIHTDALIPDVLVGDVTRLNQIFNNLLGNAIKFTHQGHVRFKVDLKEKRKNDCTLVFKIEDTGVGILPDKIETIFQPFQQSERDTTRKYGGTGLGLSIVKSLVEILNGNIQVNSTPDKGSVFSVELNFIHGTVTTLKQDLIQPGNVLAEPPPLPQKRSLKVLYVEDVESNRFLIENLLSDHHIETTTVPSGKLALQFTKLNKFDLILMDIQMPGMDGYETTRKIRNQSQGKNKLTPVLAFTAEPYSEELRRKIAIHEIQDVITKPFDADSLIEKIEQCIRPPAPATKDFSFSFYEDVFNHDLVKLKKIKKAVIKDIQRFETKMTLYDRKRDCDGMFAEIHRIRPILHKLACDQLIVLLDKYREFDGYAPEMKKITRSVVSKLKRLLVQLSMLPY